MPGFRRTTDYPLFDTHAHYNDHKFDEGGETEGRDSVLEDLFSQNIRHIVNAGTKPETNLESIALAEKYPGYGFETHKGYGTKAHYAAIHELGVCPEHRPSFLKKMH